MHRVQTKLDRVTVMLAGLRIQEITDDIDVGEHSLYKVTMLLLTRRRYVDRELNQSVDSSSNLN